MMWSQCTWDMNTWNVWPARPAGGEHVVAEDARAACPGRTARTRRRRSRSPRTRNCRRRCGRPRSRARARRRPRALSGVSSRVRPPRTSAATSLSRIAAEVMRHRDRAARSPEADEHHAPRQRARRRPAPPARASARAVPDGREDGEHHGEPADVEDLAAPAGCRAATAMVPPCALACLEASMSTRSPDAADVLDPGEVEEDPILVRRAADHVGGQRGLEGLRGRVVETTRRGEHDRVGVTLRHQVHSAPRTRR